MTAIGKALTGAEKGKLRLESSDGWWSATREDGGADERCYENARRPPACCRPLPSFTR